MVYETVTANAVGLYSEQELTSCFIAKHKVYAKNPITMFNDMLLSYDSLQV